MDRWLAHGVILVLASLTGLSSPASARDLVVGSGAEFSTVGDAIAAASPGDVVRVTAGVYEEVLDLSASGEIGNPIEIRGEEDSIENVVIRGRVDLFGDHWVIANLTLEIVGDRDGIRLRGSNNEIRGVDLSGGARDGIDGQGANNVVRDSRIHNFDAGDQDAHCIALNPGATGWLITDNELFDCSGDGVQLVSSTATREILDTRIENNVIYWSGAISRMENAIDIKDADGLIVSGNDMSGFTDNKTIVFQKAPTNVQVLCNVMRNGFTGVEFRGEDNGVVEDIVFRHNLMVGFTSYALKFDGTLRGTVQHNTFVDIDNDGLRIEGAGLAGGSIQNNLWVRTGELEGGNFDSDHNGTFQVGNNEIVSATDVDGDPLLDSEYRLREGSPMQDVGVDVGLAFEGTAPDIGAFERGGETSCETAGPRPETDAGPNGEGPEAPSSGGCGCGVGSQSPTGLLPWLLAALFFAPIARRRFRRAGSARETRHRTLAF